MQYSNLDTKHGIRHVKAKTESWEIKEWEKDWSISVYLFLLIKVKFQIQNLILEKRAGLACMPLILDCVVCIYSIPLYSVHVDLPASVSFFTESFERKSQPMQFKHWKFPLLQVWPFGKAWYCRRPSGKAAASLHCLPKLPFWQGLSARKREMSWDKIKKPTQMFKQYPLVSRLWVWLRIEVFWMYDIDGSE